MPTYVYKAADAKGKLVKGELEAVSEIEATTQLAKTGYLPISISFKAEKTNAAQEGIFKNAGKVSPQALIIFSRQFSTILKAAIPIIEGLDVLAEQTEARDDRHYQSAFSKEGCGMQHLPFGFTRQPRTDRGVCEVIGISL